MFTKEEILSFDLWLNKAKSIVLEAVKLIKEANLKAKKFDSKSSPSDLVTETDRSVEDFIKKQLASTFKDHKFIGEETFSKDCQLTCEPSWILDPIDGTTNFVHNFPFYAISLAATYKKKIVVGIVYHVIADLMYAAHFSGGAFLYELPLKVSACTEKKNALIITEWGSFSNNENTKLQVDTVLKLCNSNPAPHGVRSIGCASLNLVMVAYGMADVYYEWGIHCWDIAAGALIVTEAGGYVCDINGNELDIMGRNILALSSKDLEKPITSAMPKIEVINKFFN